MWSLSIAQRWSPAGTSMEFPRPLRIKNIIEKKKDAEMLLFSRCFFALANFCPLSRISQGWEVCTGLVGSTVGIDQWMGSNVQPIRLEISFWAHQTASVLCLKSGSYRSHYQDKDGSSAHQLTALPAFYRLLIDVPLKRYSYTSLIPSTPLLYIPTKTEHSFILSHKSSFKGWV